MDQKSHYSRSQTFKKKGRKIGGSGERIGCLNLRFGGGDVIGNVRKWQGPEMTMVMCG